MTKKRHAYPTQKQIAKLSAKKRNLVSGLLNETVTKLEGIGSFFKDSEFKFHAEKDRLYKLLGSCQKANKTQLREKRIEERKQVKSLKESWKKLNLKVTKIGVRSASKLMKQHNFKRTKPFKESEVYYLVESDKYPLGWSTLELGYKGGRFFRTLSDSPFKLLVGTLKEWKIKPRRTTSPKERILTKLGNVQQLLGRGKILEAVESFKQIDIQGFDSQVEDIYIIVRDAIDDKKREYEALKTIS